MEFCTQEEFKELNGLFSKMGSRLQLLLNITFEELKEQVKNPIKRCYSEDDVKYIADLLGTPKKLIQHYLTYTKGNREKTIDMILSNESIPNVKQDKTEKVDDLKKTLLMQLSSLEDELVRLEAKTIRSGMKSHGESDTLENERSLIEKQLREAKESKNIVYFCKGEQECLKGKSIKRWTFKPTYSFDLEAEYIHFRLAESQFHRYLATPGSVNRLTEVEYVVNPTIVKKFHASKYKLAERHGMLAESMKPIYMFHGTSEVNMENILKTNFLLSKVGSTTDMGWYGAGVYFSEFPSTSISYSGGNPWLLLCAVFVGKAFKIMDIQTGCPLTEGYDSHISGDGSEVIIFDTDCILPCYKIKWTARAQNSKPEYDFDQNF